MSIRPIEPGCMALVIAGENAGEACHVMRWVEHGDAFSAAGRRRRNLCGGGGWGVEFRDGWGVFEPHVLLRIDDHGEDADDYEVIREEWGITA